MKVLDYIPGPLGALALVISIGGSRFSWDSSQTGLAALTPLGWTAVAIGAIALLSSLFLTWRNHRELDYQSRQREKLRSVSQTEVALALREMTVPFYFLSTPDYSEREPALNLVPSLLSDPARYAEVMKIDIRSNAYDTTTWAEYLQRHAKSGAARLEQTLQIYAAYVEPDTLEILSELRTSEFLYRLRTLDEHVSDNTHVALLHLPFPRHFGEEDMDFGFERFWELVRWLERRLDRADPAVLQRRF
jgi:hypothetical protein